MEASWAVRKTAEPAGLTPAALMPAWMGDWQITALPTSLRMLSQLTAARI
jgi:hypothetical protein